MDRTRTLKSALNQVATWFPDSEAFVQAGGGPNRRYTYAEVNEEARKFANALADIGVEKGDRVGFLSQTTAEHAIAFFGTFKIGAMPVTLHHREGTGTIAHNINEIGVDVLVIQPKFVDKIKAVRVELSSEPDYIVFDQLGEPPEFAARYTDLVNSSPATEPDIRVNPEDPAFINFSSGTTSKPKPIVHTHATGIESAHLGTYKMRLRRDTKFMIVATPSFIAWANRVFPHLNIGGTIVFLDEWDPKTALETIEAERVNLLYIVTTLWKKLLEEDVTQYDLSSLQSIGYTGETISPTFLRELQEKVCENIFTGYGSTETMSTGTTLYPEDMNEETIESVGKPAPNVELRVIEQGSNDPSQEVEIGETGAIIIRGPSIAPEIWNNPEQTAELFTENGWFFIGDMGYIDERNFLYLKGRTDNMIISGGINIYPGSIENVLEEHPDISEAAVVPVEDDEWGQVLKAYVKPTDDNLTTDVLDEYCRNHDELGNHERPREFAFLEKFPRTNTEKLDRAALRERSD